VYLGSHRHWHTIPSTTATFWLHRRTLDQYLHQIMSFKNYGVDPTIGEHNTINLVYTSVPCLSPLPGLAEHVMSCPTNIFVDWNKRWHEIQSFVFAHE
jgi:hypothetical protein